MGFSIQGFILINQDQGYWPLDSRWLLLREWPLRLYICACKEVPPPSSVMVLILVCNLVKAPLSLFPVQEVAELQQQLQSSEREKEIFRQHLTEKKAEQTRREEETIRSKQQVR